MAENLVSKFTVNSQGTDIDVKIKDEDARNLIAQEISDRNSAVTAITNNLNKEISDRSELISKDSSGNTNVASSTANVSVTGKDITLNASDAINFNSTSPIKYSLPTKLNDYVGTIPMMGTDGNEYKLLTAGGLANRIGSGAYINVKDYGCKGDGITDDSNAIQSAINNNSGKTIYFPKGIYLVNKGIKLIDHTSILGDGFESVIKANANNIIVLYNDKYTDNIGKDNHAIGMVDITISNILIDGNRQETAHETTSTIIKEGTQGIGIYGGGIRMDKVMVTNCGKCGVHTGWNSYWSGANSSTDTGESVFSRCVVKWNGEEGWIYEGPHDSMLTNSVIASNSRNNHNTYDNMLVSNRGNLRITACHFYSDYGLPKAKSGLHVDPNAYQCNIDNCHIEGGGSESLILETRNNQISNCNIYACFGDADVLITSDEQWFTNCIMSEPARGEGVTSPNWAGALRIDGNRRDITGDIILNNTPLYITKPTLELAHFNLKGSGNSNYIGGRAVPEDYPANSIYYDILGEFADQSQLHYIPSRLWKCNEGLPATTNYGSFNLNGDANLYSRFGFVWGYTSGTLYLSEPSRGSIMIIGNATPSSVPIKCRGNGNQINNRDTDALAPQSTTIFFGENDHSWLKV